MASLITLCRIKECEKTHLKNRSICSTHRSRIWKHGDPDYVNPKFIHSNECKKCNNLFYCKNLCKKHYDNWKYHHDPNYKKILNKSSSKWYQNNKEKRLLKGKEWKKNNPQSGYWREPKLNKAMNNVRKRDNNICQWQKCNKRADHVHHIFLRSKYPELRYNEQYMICYCNRHHGLWHIYNGDKGANFWGDLKSRLL